MKTIGVMLSVIKMIAVTDTVKNYPLKHLLPHWNTTSPAIALDDVFKHNGNVHTGQSALK